MSTNTTRPTEAQLAAAYAEVVDAEEHLSDTQKRIKARLNELKAEMAFLERAKVEVEQKAQLSVSLLRNEDKLVAMMAEKAGPEKEGTAFQAFREEVDDLVDNVTEALDKREV
ncbi:hypothetical protein HDK90DRAFT_506008 [Phyllosticta capitalensis]|uniref:Uncharacterized protein n=1 Tax=Phyllosticta capitalensis TaxID=121624 RepID=A0ABR1Z1B9_9PEZI